MKKILFAALILALVAISAGCIGNTPAGDDVIVGSWQSTESYKIDDRYTYMYQLKFNADGVCIETDTWSDGSKSNWIGSWEKTADKKYRYELGHMYKVSADGATLTDSYGYTLSGDGFVGKWTESNSTRGTYLGYEFTSDGKGTRTVYKMSGEIYDQLSLTWKEISKDVYKIYYSEPKYYDLELVESNKLHDTTNDQYLTKI
ncbi:MAG: hypothetical protein Q4Q53_03225 [Methanocorpusculum sp.]|nr:hypothetical protein [Methanocorpusculum sp.]